MNNSSNNINPDLLNKIFEDLDIELNKTNLEEKEDNQKQCLCKKKINELNYEDIYYSEEGYVSCYNCGYVFQIDRISKEQEWRMFEDSSQDKIRCHPAKLDVFGNPMLQTYIKYSNNSFKNNAKLAKMQLYMYSKQNSIIKRENNLKDIFTENIKIYFSNEIINEVIYEYFKLEKTFRGEKRLAIIAGLMYYACKKYKINKTPHEISNIFNLENNILTSTMIELIDTYKVCNSESLPLELLENFMSRLNIQKQYTSIIEKICYALLNLNTLNTSKPQTIISSTLLFLKTKGKIIFDENHLENIASISLHTIKQYTKKILENEQMILNYINQN